MMRRCWLPSLLLLGMVLAVPVRLRAQEADSAAAATARARLASVWRDATREAGVEGFRRVVALADTLAGPPGSLGIDVWPYRGLASLEVATLLLARPAAKMACADAREAWAMVVNAQVYLPACVRGGGEWLLEPLQRLTRLARESERGVASACR